MQYIVFTIQAGMDHTELSALLEQANGMVPPDGIPQRFKWRINAPKGVRVFGAPVWVYPIPFFSNSKLEDDLTKYVPNPAWLRSLDEGKNFVIPINLTHYGSMLPHLSFKEQLEKDVRAIYVYSNNRVRLYNEVEHGPFDGNSLQIARDNILNVDPLDQNLMNALYPKGFDAIIEMDRIWTDWDYLNNILTGIGIDLPKSKYDQYLKLAGRG